MAKLKTPLQELLANALRKCIPINVQIEITKQCNLKCQFCYNDNENIFLDSNIIKKVLDDAEKLGSYMLSLTGGEPLLHPNFYEIAEYGKKRGYLLIIQTNSILINEKEAIRISELNPVCVDISLHGAKADTHDRITGVKGSFNKVIESIRFLKKLGCLVRFKVPITKYNQNELEDIKRMADDFGCKVVFDPFISPTIKGDTKPLDLQPEFSKLSYYIQYAIMDNESDLIEFESRDINGPFCGMGRNLIAITAEGNIQACMRVPIILGNIYKESIIDVWKFNDKLKKIRNISRKDIIQCRKCNLLSYCFLCPGIQLLSKKNFSEPYKEACENAILRKKYHEEKKNNF